MKSWKKQWKDELNEATPKLRSDVANSPINVVVEHNNVNASSQTSVTRRKPFWYGLSSAVAAVLIVAVLCVTLIPSQSVETFAFVVEINPSVTITADNSGNVTGIVASNADADVILSDVEAVSSLKGKPVDEAVKWYVDKAARLGFLDEDALSAVRITTVENGGKLLSKVSVSLEDYFMQRGIQSFVVADVVDLNAFAERSNLQKSESVNAMTEYVQGLEPIYRNRNVNTLSKDELQQSYKDYASSDAFVNGIGDCLSGIIDTIEQNEKDIFALSALNEQIEKHSGNPASMFKDYWSVKTIYSKYDDSAFAELMSQMDEAVSEYNAAYGDDVTSRWEMDAIARMYGIISAEELRSVLNHFTADFLKLHLDWLSDIIQTVSVDTSLIGLTTLPETAEEFANKLLDIATIERASREKQFEDAYNTVRDQITRTDYDEFKRELLARYGSTDELWNNLK